MNLFTIGHSRSRDQTLSNSLCTQQSALTVQSMHNTARWHFFCLLLLTDNNNPCLSNKTDEKISVIWWFVDIPMKLRKNKLSTNYKDHFDFRAVSNFLKHFKIISCKYNVEEECGNLKTINWQDSIRRRGSFDLYRLHEAKEKGLEFFIKKTSKLLKFL